MMKYLLNDLDSKNENLALMKISAWLKAQGHEDIATTMNYTHLNIRSRARTYQDCTRFGVCSMKITSE